MRNWLFILGIVIIGCKEDGLVPCTDEQPAGKVCREYRYYNSSPQGFVEFQHMGDSLQVATVRNASSVEVKTIRKQYDGGKLIAVTDQFPNADSRVETWHYNESDSLSFIIYGANDSTLFITYLDGKRHLETTVVNDEVTHYSELRYFEDDGKLYRVSHYNADDSLLGYRNYDYFDGNDGSFYRTTHFNGNFELIGRKRYGFSPLGLINSMEYRLADGSLAQSKEYFYDSAGKLIEEHGLLFGNTSKSVYLYY